MTRVEGKGKKGNADAPHFREILLVSGKKLVRQYSAFLTRN
jgi:hypothetical protein